MNRKNTIRAVLIGTALLVVIIFLFKGSCAGVENSSRVMDTLNRTIQELLPDVKESEDKIEELEEKKKCLRELKEETQSTIPSEKIGFFEVGYLGKEREKIEENEKNLRENHELCPDDADPGVK